MDTFQIVSLARKCARAAQCARARGHRLAIAARSIAQHLPSDFGHAPAVPGGGPRGIDFRSAPPWTTSERELILQTLAATSQNKTRAAELLGISLKTLHNKLKEYEAGRKDASQPEN